LDSIELDKILKIPAWSKVFDIGTGWWFPLLPLAILYPDSDFVWMDSTQKKILAVQDMATQLDLKNIEVVRSRAEDYKGECDYLVSRAVAYIDKLMSRTYDLVKKWWYMILYKKFTAEEKDDLDYICGRNDIKLIKQHIYSLFPGDIQRVIYILQK
jgi:16S rRNA (guanine527-N7)-methyltransferase